MYRLIFLLMDGFLLTVFNVSREYAGLIRVICYSFINPGVRDKLVRPHGSEPLLTWTERHPLLILIIFSSQ